MNNCSSKVNKLYTVDDLEMVIGWLRGLPLVATLIDGVSSSSEGKRGVSGGVSNLLVTPDIQSEPSTVRSEDQQCITRIKIKNNISLQL